MVTVGFTKQSQRQFRLWDPRSMDKALKKVDIDQAAGVIIPYYDEDTSVMYLAGKVSVVARAGAAADARARARAGGFLRAPLTRRALARAPPRARPPSG